MEHDKHFSSILHQKELSFSLFGGAKKKEEEKNPSHTFSRKKENAGVEKGWWCTWFMHFIIRFWILLRFPLHWRIRIR